MTPAPSARRKLLGVVLLKLGWMACVMGAAAGLFWLGPLYVGLVVALHLAFAPRRSRAIEALLIVSVGAIGLAADGIQVASGVLVFPEEAPRLLMLPVWIVVLWPLFATTFSSAFAWLRGRPLVAAMIGFVGGPPGYLVADRLGALQLPGPLAPTLLSLAIVWAIALPCAVELARRLQETCEPVARRSAG